MPDTREFTDAHGVAITFDVWHAAHPRAVVQLAHGVGEHARRYDHVAEALVAAGYTVYADDHRGHGRTGARQWDGDRTQQGRLGPGGLRATIAALHQFTGIIRAENPGVPLVFLGHSWGSLMGQILVNEHIADFAAVVFTGTAYRLPGSMNSGDLNAKHKHLGTTGLEWLSRDPAVAQAFLDDPLTTTTPLMKLFGVADALRLVGRPARPMPADVPLLIMVGDDDPLGGARSAHRLADSYRDRGGLTHVEVIVYPGARHEVFNETNRDDVLADLTGWLDRTIPTAG